MGKRIVEEIKIYWGKGGKGVGEWVEKGWKLIEKNELEMYEKERRGFVGVGGEMEKERKEVEGLCMVMSEFIRGEKEIEVGGGEVMGKGGEEKVGGEMKGEEEGKDVEMVEEEKKGLGKEMKVVEEYKEKGEGEVWGVGEEEKRIGKMKVNREV